MTVVLFIIITIYAAKMVHVVFLYKKPTITKPLNVQSISVIIPFRNEEHNFKNCFDSLAKQQYSGEFEMIFINDHSTDNSVNMVQEFITSHPHLQISLHYLPEHKTGKKQGVKLGIELSKYTIIATYDADCITQSNWLNEVAKSFSEDFIKIAIGEVVVPYGKKFSNLLQHSESVLTSMFTIYGVNNNRPLLISAANTAFKKDAFYELNGYSGNEHIPSGDDIFLMEKMLLHFGPKAFGTIREVVKTNAVEGMSRFFLQRIRWFKKMQYVPNLKHTHRFSFFIASVNTLLLVSVFIVPLPVFFTLLAAKYIIDIYLLSSSKHCSKNALKMSPILLVWWLFYPLILLILSRTISPNWKGRTT
jgi:poly-beta-1,6-N-acetyl-D-glucosamine synthase